MLIASVRSASSLFIHCRSPLSLCNVLSLIIMSTNITDVILRDPLKILSSEPARTEFLSQPSLGERLRVAYSLLSPHYLMQLGDLWPRTYRQVYS